MRRKDIRGVVFYVSEKLEPFSNVVAAVTTRHGGVSPAPFDTCNLSAHVGDDPAAVEENMARLHHALQLERRATVDAAQGQADRVARVTENERGTRIRGVDGLITDVPGIPLMLRFADCVPILLYDPAHEAIGIVHAGWRGTVSKVLTNTVAAMGSSFDTRPNALIACIGPSIGPCCYPVGEDVQARAREAFPERGDLLVRRNGHVHLDLWQANVIQLRALGVEQIEVAQVCTSDMTADFYSWRREGAQTGRFGALIALR
jgi:YfiH family protein